MRAFRLPCCMRLWFETCARCARRLQMDDTSSAACQTEFAGDLHRDSDEMRASLQGHEARNLSQFDVAADAPNRGVELDPAQVRALATRLLTEGEGRLAQLMGEPIAPVATLQLLKFAKESVHELLEQSREAVLRAAVSGRYPS